MATNTHLVSVDNLDHAPEYYEEIDHYTLDFLNRQGRPSKAPPQLAREPTPAIDPVQQLNEQLNRQYRPDLVSDQIDSRGAIEDDVDGIRTFVCSTID